MHNPLRPILQSLARKYLTPVINNLVDDKLLGLIHHQTADQLFYDVANFAIYNQIPGDYMEFGAYQGDSLAKMYQYLSFQWRTFQEHAAIFDHPIDRSYWDKIRFLAFDSFAGLPPSSSPDTPIHFSKGGIYAASVDRFQSNILAMGVDPSKVITISGWFNQILRNELAQQHSIRAACVIFIDCDLYESATPVFTFITPIVHDGTVIIIDDFFRYRGHPQRGVRRAFNEWRQGCPHIGLSKLGQCSANRLAFVCHLE